MDSKLVLLIEDDPNDGELTRRALLKNNIMNEVIVACDGETALSRLYESASPIEPDLIVIDLRLPRMSGLDVLRRIRAEKSTRHVPAVVLTSYTDDQIAKACYEAGANSFVRKPSDPGEFQDMVVGLGMYWLLLNVGPQDVGSLRPA